jgi:hypothetical protein
MIIAYQRKNQRNQRNLEKKIKNNITMKTKKTKPQFFFNPENPEKSFDVYIDKDPSDTINIKYSTLDDVKNTINKLERLYKQKKYSHKRIFQVAMIMMVRLKVIVNRFNKGETRFNLSKRFKNFLNRRTKLSKKDRFKAIFKTGKTKKQKKAKKVKQ